MRTIISSLVSKVNYRLERTSFASALLQAHFWLGRGLWAVLDQGLFSGANFLVNILLARWLAPEEYGAFAVALLVFYFLAAFHMAVLTEPMMVFGAGKYREHFHKYLGILLYGHWGISALIALALGVAAFVFAHYGSQAMARALTGLAVASPFLLLIWLVRRACYVPMQPVWAAAGSGINLAVTLAGLFLLWRAGLLSSLSGLVLLGAASAIASLGLLALPLRPRLRGFTGNPVPATVLSDHWRYGRWSLAESIIYSISNHLLVVLISIFLGLAESGVFAAIMNFYRPVNLFTQAMTVVLLPTFSAWKSRSMSVQRLRRKGLLLGILMGVLIALYSVLLTIAWHPMVESIYAGKYDKYATLSLLIGINYSLSAFGYSAILVMKVQQQIRMIPVIIGISGLVSLAFFVPLTLSMNILGAALAYGIGRICFAYFSVRFINKVTQG